LIRNGKPKMETVGSSETPDYQTARPHTSEGTAIRTISIIRMRMFENIVLRIFGQRREGGEI
jgi:hypothetical protein